MVTYSYLFRSVNSMKLLFIYLIWRASRQLLGSEPQDHRERMTTKRSRYITGHDNGIWSNAPSLTCWVVQEGYLSGQYKNFG